MIYNYIVRIYPLFRVMEIKGSVKSRQPRPEWRTLVCSQERTEGANLSEKSSNKRI